LDLARQIAFGGHVEGIGAREVEGAECSVRIGLDFAFASLFAAPAVGKLAVGRRGWLRLEQEEVSQCLTTFFGILFILRDILSIVVFSAK